MQVFLGAGTVVRSQGSAPHLTEAEVRQLGPDGLKQVRRAFCGFTAWLQGEPEYRDAWLVAAGIVSDPD